MKTLWAYGALPAGLLVLTLGFAAGCSSTDSLTSCDIQAKVDALGTAATELDAAAASMRVKLATACSKISGGTFSGSTATDDDVTTNCDKASADIKAKFKAAGSVTVNVVPGKCEVDASAQLNCEAKCDVSGKCDPGMLDITARCDPGDLSVVCSGECSGTLECEASASAAVSCEGSCNGSCEGSCEGTCAGDCDGTCTVKDADGKCAGECKGTCKGTCGVTCSGKCQGSCTAEASADAKCEGTARCKGECSVKGTAPKCEGELKAVPPSCDIDADCEAGCSGQASLKAECTPPQVVISVDGDIDAEFLANVQENLPVVLQVGAQAELAANAAGDVGEATGKLVAEIAKLPACVAKVGADLTAKLSGSVKAAASVSVSVMASASVSGSATAGSK
jgi:hypothetical protein